jgi:SAM-dependent methyltransferase
MRSMVHLLSRELFGESLALPDFPVRKDLIGFGLSDWSVYAEPLRQRVNYINTFYHTAPMLDITEVPDKLQGIADFLIATDVFEHVLPPVSLAFEGARRLLRPGGVFIFSVPYHSTDGATVEHFPRICDFDVRQDPDGVYRLRNQLPDGTEELYEDLVFHGGPGSTLEMRVFSRDALLQEFRAAGFRDVVIESAEEPRWGIYWNTTWSMPIVARA